MKNKKKIIEVIAVCVVCVIAFLILTVFIKDIDDMPSNNNGGDNNGSNNGTNQDGHYYDELFDGDIMEINIQMSKEDVFLLRETPSEDVYYYSDITINGINWKNVGIRPRGKKNIEAVYESGSDKYSYKLDFNHYDKENKFYGLDGLYLNNMIEDESYIAQYISYKLAEKLGAIVPYYTLAKVTVNGENEQWYIVTEEMNNSFAKRVTGDDGTVALFKADNEDAILDANDSGVNYQVEYGDDATPSYIDKLVKALNKDTVSETEIEAILDVESVLKNVAINFVVGNYAGYQGTDPDNFYLLYDNGKISYIEKDYVGAGGNYRKDMGYSKTVLASKPFFNVDGYKRPLVSKLLSIEKYKNMYEGYVDQVYSYLKDSTVVDEAKKLLGDYTDTDAYKSAEKRLFSYIYRERD